MRKSLARIFDNLKAPLLTARAGNPLRRLRGAMNVLDWTIAVTLGAAALTTVAYAGGDADDKTKVTEFLQNFTAFQRNMRADAPNYGSATLSGSVLIDNGVVPAGMKNGTSLRHPWSNASNAVTVVGATSTWTYTTDQTVSKAGCTAILRGLSNNQGVTQVVVGGGSPVTTLPADKTSASTACSGSTNAITITSS